MKSYEDFLKVSRKNFDTFQKVSNLTADMFSTVSKIQSDYIKGYFNNMGNMQSYTSPAEVSDEVQKIANHASACTAKIFSNIQKTSSEIRDHYAEHLKDNMENFKK